MRYECWRCHKTFDKRGTCPECVLSSGVYVKLRKVDTPSKKERAAIDRQMTGLNTLMRRAFGGK